jgi:membrane-associated phospholipid phosphatase
MSERSRSHGRVRYPEAVWRVVRLILGRLTLAIAAAFVALFLFAYVAHEMLEGETRAFDTAAILFFRRHPSPGVHALMTAISWLAGTGPLIVTVLLAAAGFWRTGRFWPDGVSLLVASVGGAGVLLGLKDFFHRPRPDPVFARLGYSFPSGHAFFALTIYGMLAYLLSRDAPPRRRRQRWGATVVAILLVGFSRVFLGVHYPSDVVAGFLVALPWLWGCLALPQALRWVRLWRQR